MMTTAKPTFRQLLFHAHSSLNIKVDKGDTLTSAWHYHPEMELILLKRSRGTSIIGNSIEPFKHNDVFLIGKSVPHSFHHEETDPQNQCQPPEAVVVQFYETFMGKEFLELPESRDIQRLFQTARQGLCLTEKGKEEVIPLIEKMLHASSLDRIILLLQILRILVNSGSFHLLGDDESSNKLKSASDRRIKTIMEYTAQHYDKNIRIEQLAAIVNLTRESFCRYFKTQTGKSYLGFLIEFRIAKACKLILHDEISIKEIAYSCGFDSLSNFHYQFKKITGQSPVEYKLSGTAFHPA
jgi:AraC-like DNA-binding protein